MRKKEERNSLHLHRPPSRRETLAGVRLQNVQAVKEKLLEEIIELESQLAKVKSSGDPLDLSLIQTYREMIHSRRAFFTELNR
ncbi:MAG TPA: hypothetical protein VGK97_08090 [Spongiibacteraceae bacterium]|jgi:hypothetical protein